MYNGLERREIKSKIDVIHDAIIRLEPVIKEVEKIREWKDGKSGNAVPGAQTQVWILWFCFLGLVGLMMSK